SHVFKYFKRPREIVAAYYRNAMHSAVANKMSSIINISLNDIVPRRAEDIINTLIDVYNNDAINDKQQIAEATAEFIDVRLAIISKELGSVDSDIKTFKTRNSMVDIETETTKNITESSKLKTEVLSLENQIEMSKFIYEYLKDASKEYVLIPVTDLSKGQGSALSKQIAEYNELLLRRERYLQNSSLNNPVIQQLDRDRVALKNAILASLDSNIQTLEIQLGKLSTEQKKTDALLSIVPKQEQEYLSIARQQRIKEELYLYLLNKREENAISLAITENTARIVDSAFGPLRPVAPRKSFILLIALVLGCAVPFVILYLRELLDTTVRSKHDITKFTSVPYLGDIPVYNGPRTARGVVVRANGRDNVSEAFRIVRTNMAFMNTEGQDSQVLLVTSSNQHAGKTFVSTNLAMTLAMSGNKVLLIDLDLRRRTMSKHMGQRNNPVGISRYMSDKNVKVTDIISRTELHENFDCIYAGLQPPNPAEQLMSNRLDELIAECRKLYDYVVIDSVPALVIADAIIASRVADLTLYIVREGLLDRRQLPDIDSLYKQDKLKNMCILLNGASERSHRYGYTYDDDSEIVYTRFEKVLCKMGFGRWVRKRKNQ
ncbi:MAG: polysaccharide biosynthesis tyrosine autokinase, partial [Alistipes sp.]|nr:polysaccharide biosynthesis tyrosine autokinase [Alistipes sp.]